jgi:hypothetical protein
MFSVVFQVHVSNKLALTYLFEHHESELKEFFAQQQFAQFNMGFDYAQYMLRIPKIDFRPNSSEFKDERSRELVRCISDLIIGLDELVDLVNSDSLTSPRHVNVATVHDESVVDHAIRSPQAQYSSSISYQPSDRQSARMYQDDVVLRRSNYPPNMPISFKNLSTTFDQQATRPSEQYRSDLASFTDQNRQQQQNEHQQFHPYAHTQAPSMLTQQPPPEYRHQYPQQTQLQSPSPRLGHPYSPSHT